jgi:hypothetical protein
MSKIPVSVEKQRCTTKNIDYWADDAKLKVNTINKTYSGLIVWSIAMHNAPYSVHCKN